MAGRAKTSSADHDPEDPPFECLPAHVAIIMDGNGRWAKRHGWRRMRGHEHGAKSVREVIETSAELGIRELTLYAFSTENWSRPQREIDFLMDLLQKQLVVERKTLMENNYRLRAIGRLEGLSPEVQSVLGEAIEMSASNTGLTVRLALNYGGRGEIVDAARSLAEEVRKGDLSPNDIDEQRLREHLYDADMTDPDLLIRTGGERRVSNFLLWWLSYTELYMTPTYWPDFRRPQFEKALRDYAARQRRFGGVPEEDATSGDKSAAVHALPSTCEDSADQ